MTPRAEPTPARALAAAAAWGVGVSLTGWGLAALVVGSPPSVRPAPVAAAPGDDTCAPDSPPAPFDPRDVLIGSGPSEDILWGDPAPSSR